jgi:hypothetical protein
VISLRRLLAGTAALLAVSLTASACDSSPYAAKVNAQVIKEAALNAELRDWAGNADYVSAFNSSNTSGVTVAGQATGTYNTMWVGYILDGIVSAEAIHQELAATGRTPTPATVAAARSVDEIGQPGWSGFSPAFRQVLVSRLADEATLIPTSAAITTLQGLYNQYRQYFFTQVCTVEAAAFTQSQAASLSAAGVPNGTPTCYDQAQFETQSTAFQTAILALAVGKVAAPIRTSYGFQVVKVVSRNVQPFSADVGRVLSVASAQSASPVLTSLLAKAHVQINPAYGTWKASQVTSPVSPSPNI